MDDRDYLSALVGVTRKSLPEPKTQDAEPFFFYHYGLWFNFAAAELSMALHGRVFFLVFLLLAGDENGA